MIGGITPPATFAVWQIAASLEFPIPHRMDNISSLVGMSRALPIGTSYRLVCSRILTPKRRTWLLVFSTIGCNSLAGDRAERSPALSIYLCLNLMSS